MTAAAAWQTASTSRVSPSYLDSLRPRRGCDRSPVMVRMRPVAGPADRRRRRTHQTDDRRVSTCRAVPRAAPSRGIRWRRSAGSCVRFATPCRGARAHLRAGHRRGAPRPQPSGRTDRPPAERRRRRSRASRAASDRASVQSTSTSAGSSHPSSSSSAAASSIVASESRPSSSNGVSRSTAVGLLRPAGVVHEGIESPQRRSWPREWS